VPVLARVVEATGIPTVTVTMMPVFSDKYRTSRVLGVEFPFGHSFGMVQDREMQTRTLRAALELLEAAPGPETRVDVEEQWPVESREAYKSWQPSEPSPIVAASIDQIRKSRREAAALEPPSTVA
jgi:hypothetical protein